MKLVLSLLMLASCHCALSAQTFAVSVDASTVTGEIVPLWNDYWELNVQHGYGPHAGIFQNVPHTPFIEDPGFVETMDLLRPRSVKVSIGTFIYLPHVDYASTDTAVLKALPTEFYRGANNLVAADDPDNYYFDYLDAQLAALDSVGIEPFLNIDYMPFTLAANQVPMQHIGPLLSLYHLDNEIRTSPPRSNAVYARVIRNVIRHTQGLFKGSRNYGIRYYEVWNEPDQPNLVNFWGGDADQLYEMYRAIVAEVENDPDLKDVIKIGCCSFALPGQNVTFAENFLTELANDATRLDFLSVHPYAADPFSALDTTILAIGQAGIELYAPNAELINAEWGILNNASSAFINSLEHELVNLRDVTLMLDKDVKFAHYVNLVEFETNQTQTTGICLNNPIRPKINAVARAHLNQLRITPNRLATAGELDEFLLAGKNAAEDTIVIAIAAPKPASGQSRTIELRVHDLPFPADYEVTVFELSESSFEQGDYFPVIQAFTADATALSLTLNYVADQNSGRLYTIVLAANETSGLTAAPRSGAAIELFPNPTTHAITIQANRPRVAIECIVIFNAIGQRMGHYPSVGGGRSEIDLSRLANGLYFVRVTTSIGEVWKRLLKQ